MDTFGINSGIQAKLKQFFEFINEMNIRSQSEGAFEIAAEIVARSGYLAELKADNSIFNKI